jgi:hypothetical protein
MLVLLTVLTVLAVGYAQVREGLLTAFTVLCGVCIAGVVAFTLGEPMAAGLVKVIPDFEGYEDAICLVGLFSATLALMRWACNSLAPTQTEMPALAQQIGAGLCGAVTGYLVAGFLTVVVQTLPLPDHFLGFDHRVESENPLRRYLPADHVWLALLERASEVPLSRGNGQTFDGDGAFEQTYARYRRIKE